MNICWKYVLKDLPTGFVSHNKNIPAIDLSLYHSQLPWLEWIKYFNQIILINQNITIQRRTKMLKDNNYCYHSLILEIDMLTLHWYTTNTNKLNRYETMNIPEAIHRIPYKPPYSNMCNRERHSNPVYVYVNNIIHKNCNVCDCLLNSIFMDMNMYTNRHKHAVNAASYSAYFKLYHGHLFSTMTCRIRHAIVINQVITTLKYANVI